MPKWAGVPKSEEDTDYVQIAIDTVSQPEAMIAGGVLALVLVIAAIRAALPSREDYEEYDDVYEDDLKPPRRR